MLESITMYLKDEVGMSFKEIAKMLDRNYKTIWTSYQKAKKKKWKIKKLFASANGFSFYYLALQNDIF